MKSSTGEKGIFLVSLFSSEEKTDEGKVFMLAKLGTVKVCLLSLLHFKLEDLRNVSPIAFSSKSLPFGLMLSLAPTKGVVEVHSLGDSTVIFVLCDSV